MKKEEEEEEVYGVWRGEEVEEEEDERSIHSSIQGRGGGGGGGGGGGEERSVHSSTYQQYTLSYCGPSLPGWHSLSQPMFGSPGDKPCNRNEARHLIRHGSTYLCWREPQSS